MLLPFPSSRRTLTWLLLMAAMPAFATAFTEGTHGSAASYHGGVVEDIYVAPDGDDAEGDGSQANPVATIARAMELAAPHATAENFVTIHLAPNATYAEAVVFVPHVGLRGMEPDSRENTRILPPAEALQGAAVVAAESTDLRNVTIELPPDAPEGTVLVQIAGVRMVLQRAALDGGGAPGAIGIDASGPGSSESLVSHSIIERVHIGLRTEDSGLNVTRNAFRDVALHAVIVQAPEWKSSGEVPATPLLGDFARMEETGVNTFRNIGGLFVQNQTDVEVQAQVNNWGPTEEEEVAARMEGSVNFEPILKGPVLGSSIFVTVVDAETGAAINNATVSLEPPSLPPLSAGTNGLYAFTPVSDGSYTINVAAAAFEQRNFNASVGAGDAVAVTANLNFSLTQARQTLLAAFDDADTTGDGFLSFEEVLAVLPDLTQEAFNLLDTNGDGRLSREELSGAVAPPPSGCNCSKSINSWDDVHRFLGDWFLLAVLLLALGAWPRRKGMP